MFSCSAPSTHARSFLRIWWWSEAQPCCPVSCTGCWPRYASWWRNPNTATCWPARACVYTLHLPSPIAPPGSEVRYEVLFKYLSIPAELKAFWVSRILKNLQHTLETICQPFSGFCLWPLISFGKSVFIWFSSLQVLSSGRCRTSWAAGQCHETTTTRQAASQTGAVWAPLLLNPSTKQERPLLHSWREPSPQRSKMCRKTFQTLYSRLF